LWQLDEANKKYLGDRNLDPRTPLNNISPEYVAFICDILNKNPQEKKHGRVYRLPTEKEWEYVCRAGTATPFSFGNSLDGKANFSSVDEQPGLCGKYLPNQWGFYDMHGNVVEMTSSYYNRERSLIVTRGGNWKSHENDCRSAFRTFIGEKDAASVVGFRLVVEIQK